LHGQRIGYVRVSSFDQNPERQLEQIQVDKVFTDKASGKDTRRPELERLLAFVREGDTVVVHSMDRLARNLDDLRRLVQGLTQRGVRIEFLKEHLTGPVAGTGQALRQHPPLWGADVVRVKFVKSAQRLGFSLDEIAELLRLDDGTHCEEASSLAEHKLKDVREKMADLARMETVLSELVCACHARKGNVSCPLIASLQGEAGLARSAMP